MGMALWGPPAVAAQSACRAASNGHVFLNRIEKDLGLKFEVISAEDEARLSVLGCGSLLEREAEYEAQYKILAAILNAPFAK